MAPDRSQSDPEDVDDALEPPNWPVPWHAQIPGAMLAAGMGLAWLLHIGSGGMAAWGVSGTVLAQGRLETIALHMFAHGGLLHILMNGSALVAISGPLIARLGNVPESWLRYSALFVLSGLAGMAVFLLIHPKGNVPMLGASGAIYGLLGLLLRLPPGDEP